MVKLTTTSKISFREQARNVVAETTIESDEMDNDELLAENKKFFNKAMEFSRLKSLEKLQ